MKNEFSRLNNIFKPVWINFKISKLLSYLIRMSAKAVKP